MYHVLFPDADKQKYLDETKDERLARSKFSHFKLNGECH
jgi:hypothetical protein